MKELVSLILGDYTFWTAWVIAAILVVRAMMRG